MSRLFFDNTTFGILDECTNATSFDVEEQLYKFAGYPQEDAKEFLVVLLDRLHEDLNRVKNKLYIVIDDDNACSNKTLADIYHAHHTPWEYSIT